MGPCTHRFIQLYALSKMIKSLRFKGTTQGLGARSSAVSSCVSSPVGPFWLTGLVGWLSGWLGGWIAGWPAGRLAANSWYGLLPGWLFGRLASRYCMLAVWLIGGLAPRTDSQELVSSGGHFDTDATAKVCGSCARRQFSTSAACLCMFSREWVEVRAGGWKVGVGARVTSVSK